jgi:hypothetical protein
VSEMGLRSARECQLQLLCSSRAPAAANVSDSFTMDSELSMSDARIRRREERAAAIEKRLSGGFTRGQSSMSRGTTGHRGHGSYSGDFEVESEGEASWGAPGGLDAGPKVFEHGGEIEAEGDDDVGDDEAFALDGTEDLDEIIQPEVPTPKHRHVVAANMSSRSLASEVPDSDDEEEDDRRGGEKLSEKNPMKYPPIPVGSRVTALFAASSGGDSWFSGRISQRNADGTYLVLYDDDDEEDGVKPWDIKVQSASIPAPAAVEGDTGSRGMVERQGSNLSPQFGRVRDISEISAEGFQASPMHRQPSPPMTVRTMSAGGYSMTFEEEEEDEEEEGGPEQRDVPPPPQQVGALRSATFSNYSMDFESAEESLRQPSRPQEKPKQKQRVRVSDRGTSPKARTVDVGTQTDLVMPSPPPTWMPPPPGPQPMYAPWQGAFVTPNMWGYGGAPSITQPMAGMSPVGAAAYLRALAQAVAENSASSAGTAAPTDPLRSTTVFRRQLQLLRAQVADISKARTAALGHFG